MKPLPYKPHDRRQKIKQFEHRKRTKRKIDPTVVVFKCGYTSLLRGRLDYSEKFNALFDKYELKLEQNFLKTIDSSWPTRSSVTCSQEVTRKTLQNCKKCRIQHAGVRDVMNQVEYQHQNITDEGFLF